MHPRSFMQVFGDAEGPKKGPGVMMQLYPALIPL